MGRTPHDLALPGATDDPDHEMVDRLLPLHPPRDSDIADRLDHIRQRFRTIAHEVVDIVPRTPDRTLALRAIHRASQETIGSLASNQGLVPTSEE